MNMGAGIFAQPTQVIAGLRIILLTANQLLDIWVEGLDADFEL